MGLKRKTNTESMISPTVVTGAKIASFLVPKMFKDSKGKWSSRRTIGGFIAIAAVHQIEVAGEVTWQHLVMLALSVATLYAAK